MLAEEVKRAAAVARRAAVVARRRDLSDLSAQLRRQRTATASAICPASREQLDYVASLGVDAIWLSPFFTSPMRDFGYDVADYCDVDPVFGTLADFDALVERAHALGLKVIIDQVYSHSSDQHRLVPGKPLEPNERQGRLVRLGGCQGRRLAAQ